ncbi:MAG TPA: hypothetical protein VE958_02230 [Bryobacteraceae bacterium]|nr:hypothetical protein [Bryobacteraceae bacterium]
MRIPGHAAFGFLRVLAFGAVFVLFIGLSMELVAALRAKIMRLRLAPTTRALLYLAIALAAVTAILLAIVFVPMPRLRH